jgi:hypothetical protein
VDLQGLVASGVDFGNQTSRQIRKGAKANNPIVAKSLCAKLGYNEYVVSALTANRFAADQVSELG